MSVHDHDPELNKGAYMGKVEKPKIKNSKWITAEDMRRQTQGLNDDAQLLNIMSSLKSAGKNSNHIFFYEEMTDYTRRTLTDIGYKVGATEYDNREGGYLTKISW